MRFRAFLLVVVAFTLPASVFAQIQGTPTPQHGVQLGDLDRTADPCTDFFQYANGSWRASHPIPASMSRWSRRWEAGETAKERLRDILEDVSRRTDWPRGSVEQLIGDYYGSCIDEARINKLGLAPAAPTLKEIDAMQGSADLQRMIRRLQGLGVSVAFGLGSSPDNHNPRHTTPVIYASPLALPTPPYYLKPI